MLETAEGPGTMLGTQGWKDWGYYFEEEEKYNRQVQPFAECHVEEGTTGQNSNQRGKLQGDRFQAQCKKKRLTIRAVPEQSKHSLWLLVGDSDDDNFHLSHHPPLSLCLSICISTSFPILKINPPSTLNTTFFSCHHLMPLFSFVAKSPEGVSHYIHFHVSLHSSHASLAPAPTTPPKPILPS